MKIIVVAPTTAVPIRTGLAVALNVLPGAVVLLRGSPWAALEVHVEPEVLSSGLAAIGNLLDRGELVDTTARCR
jgi:hypothetical protein